ncbi:hypothetical protein [Sinorhizobium sp. CCBAU 05631]|uniref:hypothetical protein n=1 Tax=Sinorhizobium sp. CCBAU 05631 TaxID=794846 RepID=UPI00056CD331|nr:hypothetical protein [Sinorhizobium sp. CCBAU 05631]ASY58291.1 diguanylate cyclase/phosphodiesterase (GGDEF & EAL domains) with PAS/PAC sensor(s) [Sinorhizobium sp. CCBAU 05631]
MNIRHGMFRLWLVVSILWVAVIVVIGWDNIIQDRWYAGAPFWEGDPLAELPVVCADARGIVNTDYTSKSAVEPWNRDRSPSYACWYEEARFRALWPEYSDLTHLQISDKLYERLGWSRQFQGDQFERTKPVLLFALLPPAVLFLIGALFLWAFAGFARPKEP